MRDLLIVGGGPVGIYAAFIATLRGLEVTIIEGDSRLGGQAINVFGKKAVYDMPGFPDLTGEELVNNSYDQLMTKKDKVQVLVGEKVLDIKKEADKTFTINTSKGTYKAKTILLTTGNGLYQPRKLGVEYNDAANVIYTVDDFEKFKGKNVVVFGGGDSALDWANMIADNGASKVTLVHRRDEFRAKGESVETFRNKKNTEILTPFSPKEVKLKDGLATSIVVKSESEERELDSDFILVNFGAEVNRDMVKTNFDLKIEKMKIATEAWMKTSEEGVWAIGNACYYEGKITVIVAGYGEAVSAVASIATYIDPKASPTFLSSAQTK